MEDVITIQIAPDLCDIHCNGSTISTEFAGMRIVYEIEHMSVRKMTAKRYLQQAIALSSKTYQIERLLNMAGITGKIKVTQL